jgi:hypothetical protein
MKKLFGKLNKDGRFSAWRHGAFILLSVAALILLASCGEKPVTDSPAATSTLTPVDTPTATITPTITPTFTPEPTSTPTVIPTPTLSFEVPAPKEGKGTVVVPVFNEKGEPGANMSVLLAAKGQSADDAISGYTDKDGYVIFKNVEPGSYTVLLHISTVQYISAKYAISEEYSVEAGQTVVTYPQYAFKDNLEVISPKQYEEDVSPLPTFKWKEYPGTAYYEFSVMSARDTSFFAEPIRVETTEYTFDHPLAECGYFWGVEAFNEGGHKIGSTQVQTFLSGLIPPHMSMLFDVKNPDNSCYVNIVSPEDEANVVGTDGVEFSWEAHPLAAYYRLTIKDKDSKSFDEYEIKDGQTSYKVDAIPQGTYIWQVEACDDAGERIAASQIVTLIVK